MKIVVVQFADDIDISSLAPGTSVGVGAVAGGTILAAAPVFEMPNAVPSHRHSVPEVITDIPQ